MSQSGDKVTLICLRVRPRDLISDLKLMSFSNVFNEVSVSQNNLCFFNTKLQLSSFVYYRETNVILITVDHHI